jgi:hypothetical protein
LLPQKIGQWVAIYLIVTESDPDAKNRLSSHWHRSITDQSALFRVRASYNGRSSKTYQELREGFSALQRYDVWRFKFFWMRLTQ